MSLDYDFADMLGMNLNIGKGGTLTGKGKLKLPFGLLAAKADPIMITGLYDESSKTYVALVHVMGDLVLGAMLTTGHKAVITVLTYAKFGEKGFKLFEDKKITKAKDAIPFIIDGAKRIYAGKLKDLKEVTEQASIEEFIAAVSLVC